MNRTHTMKLEDLLALHAACDFLTRREREQLVEGRLPVERLQDWERHANECVHCATFQEDLRVFRRTAEAGGILSAESAAFDSYEDRNRERLRLGKRVRRFRKPWLWIPAGAIAALLAVVVWLGGGPPLVETPDALPFLPPPAVRGATEAEAWKSLEPLWREENWSEAVALLDSIAAKENPDPGLLLYLGVAQLEAGRERGAVETLERLDGMQAEIPSETTRYFLAVALDRSGERAAACRRMEQVASMGGARAGEAERIVRERCDE